MGKRRRLAVCALRRDRAQQKAHELAFPCTSSAGKQDRSRKAVRGRPQGQLTSLADLAMSEKAGTDMVAVVRMELRRRMSWVREDGKEVDR